MEKIINSYETLFITDLSNGQEAAKATVNKFTGLIGSNGEIVEVAEWGKRRLAYLINDMNEGYYVVVTHKTVPSFLAELDRLFNIDETIMRSLTVELDTEPLITHSYPLSKIDEAYELFENKRDGVIKIAVEC